jgi:hypothetical protein
LLPGATYHSLAAQALGLDTGKAQSGLADQWKQQEREAADEEAAALLRAAKRKEGTAFSLMEARLREAETKQNAVRLAKEAEAATAAVAEALKVERLREDQRLRAEEEVLRKAAQEQVARDNAAAMQRQRFVAIRFALSARLLL